MEVDNQKISVEPGYGSLGCLTDGPLVGDRFADECLELFLCREVRESYVAGVSLEGYHDGDDQLHPCDT